MRIFAYENMSFMSVKFATALMIAAIFIPNTAKSQCTSAAWETAQKALSEAVKKKEEVEKLPQGQNPADASKKLKAIEETIDQMKGSQTHWSALAKSCKGNRRKKARAAAKSAKAYIASALKAQTKQKKWIAIWSDAPGNKQRSWYCTKTSFGNEFCFDQTGGCEIGRKRHDPQGKSAKTQCKPKKYAFCRNTQRERWGGCYGSYKECTHTTRRKGQDDDVCRPNHP